MTDEMDLVSQLKNAEPLRPEAYERARTALRAAMAEPGSVRVLKETPVQNIGFPGARNRRRGVGTAGKVGIGAGIGVAAAAAAIALVATSGSSGTAVPATSIGAASQTPAAPSSPLVTLAAYIKKTDHSSGDASLVVQSQQIGHQAPTVQYIVYADNGAIYAADSRRSLPAAITPHNNSADGTNAADVKVALYAADGNLAKARLMMINNSQNYLGLGLSPDAQKKEWAKGYQAAKEIYKEKGVKGAPAPMTAKRAQEEADNLLWTNTYIALTGGGGNPQVREGVLRLLSTISGVTVAHTTTNGAATLTLTAGPEVFGGEGNQVLVIDAKTGAPISSVVNTPGVPQSVETYNVSRVTLSSIKAGKF